MQLIPSTHHDLARIIAFYQDVIEHTPGITQYARWIYGKHPSDAKIQDYIQKQELYHVEENGRLTAAVVVTSAQEADYHPVQWKIALADEEVAVLHLLCVHPQKQKQGQAKELLQAVLCMAQDKHKKAVRLDTTYCNIPAQKLYASMGFQKCGVQHWYNRSTGWMDFFLYEYIFVENQPES